MKKRTASQLKNSSADIEHDNKYPMIEVLRGFDGPHPSIVINLKNMKSIDEFLEGWKEAGLPWPTDGTAGIIADAKCIKKFTIQLNINIPQRSGDRTKFISEMDDRQVVDFLIKSDRFHCIITAMWLRTGASYPIDLIHFLVLPDSREPVVYVKHFTPQEKEPMMKLAKKWECNGEVKKLHEDSMTIYNRIANKTDEERNKDKLYC